MVAGAVTEGSFMLLLVGTVACHSGSGAVVRYGDGAGEIGKDNYCMSTRSFVLYVCGHERAQIAHEHFDVLTARVC